MENRRNFLKKGLTLALGGVALKFTGKNSIEKIETLVNEIGTNSEGPFHLPALPYAFNALEPVIDARTMEIHHGKHHQAYITNLNKALEGKKFPNEIGALCKEISKYDLAVRNNAGGHYNHSLFWNLMKANPDNQKNTPSGKIADGIAQSFGSFEEMKKKFSEAAMKRFGSGWAWLIENKTGKLEIGSTPNQDNPLMDCSEIKGRPLLALDVWEHAYYLKYQNKRAEYIENWFSIVNWDYVNELLAKK